MCQALFRCQRLFSGNKSSCFGGGVVGDTDNTQVREKIDMEKYDSPKSSTKC